MDSTLLVSRIQLENGCTNSTRNPGEHHSERLHLLFVPATDLPGDHPGGLFHSIALWVLVLSEVLPDPDQDHVPGHQLLLCIHSILGHGRAADKTDWVPQRGNSIIIVLFETC